MTNTTSRSVLYIHPEPAQVDDCGTVRLESCALSDFLAGAIGGDHFDSTFLFPRAKSSGAARLQLPPGTTVHLLDLPLLARSISAIVAEILRLPRRMWAMLELCSMCRSTNCLIVVGYSSIGTLAALFRRPSRRHPLVFIIRGNRLRTAQCSNRPWLRKQLLIWRLRLHRLVMWRMLKRGRAEAWFQGEGNLQETALAMNAMGLARLHLLNAVLDDLLAAKASAFEGKSPLMDVVFVGRLVKEKGLLDLIKAVQRMHSRGSYPVVHLIGAGPDEALIRRTISAAGLDQQFVFRGMVSDRLTVLNNIASARVLVLPSHTEGLPRVAVEAMACKTPTVLTAVGGIPLAFTDGVDAFIVPPHRPDRLADALVTALNMPSQDRQTMTTHAAGTAAAMSFTKRSAFVRARLHALIDERPLQNCSSADSP